MMRFVTFILLAAACAGCASKSTQDDLVEAVNRGSFERDELKRDTLRNSHRIQNVEQGARRSGAQPKIDPNTYYGGGHLPYGANANGQAVVDEFGALNPDGSVDPLGPRVVGRAPGVTPGGATSKVTTPRDPFAEYQRGLDDALKIVERSKALFDRPPVRTPAATVSPNSLSSVLSSFEEDDYFRIDLGILKPDLKRALGSRLHQVILSKRKGYSNPYAYKVFDGAENTPPLDRYDLLEGTGNRMVQTEKIGRHKWRIWYDIYERRGTKYWVVIVHLIGRSLVRVHTA